MRRWLIKRLASGDVQLFVLNNTDNTADELSPIAHHADEFNFGYGGSGPATLALTILCSYFREKATAAKLYGGELRAWPLHQDFKWSFCAGSRAHIESFEITEKEVEQWLIKQEPSPLLQSAQITERR